MTTNRFPLSGTELSMLFRPCERGQMMCATPEAIASQTEHPTMPERKRGSRSLLIRPSKARRNPDPWADSMAKRKDRSRSLLIRPSKAPRKPDPWADSCFVDMWVRVPLPASALFTLTFLKWSRIPSILLRLQEFAHMTRAPCARRAPRSPCRLPACIVQTRGLHDAKSAR